MTAPHDHLRTDRLVLRAWDESEIERLLEIRGNPDIAQWLGDRTPWPDLKRASEAVAQWSDELAMPDAIGTWAIVPHETGLASGTLNLSALPGSTEVHIGWTLHPDSLGRGYASEAARAALGFAFAYGLARVWALMTETNAASARVALAAGMTDLGVIDDPWYGTPEEPRSRTFRIDSNR